MLQQGRTLKKKVLSERHQTQNGTYYTIPLIGKIQNKQMDIGPESSLVAKGWKKGVMRSDCGYRASFWVHGNILILGIPDGCTTCEYSKWYRIANFMIVTFMVCDIYLYKGAILKRGEKIK